MQTEIIGDDMNKKIIAGLVSGVVIVAAIFAGLTLYYSNIINEKDTQIASLNAEIASLESEIANLRKPNLVTALGIYESISSLPYDENDPSTYNRLLISGTVTNFGLSTAYNSGLHVVAVDVTGEVVVNMTVPIAAGSYGLEGNEGPSTLIDLPSKETGEAQLAIYHKGVASSWTIMPVWTDQK